MKNFFFLLAVSMMATISAWADSVTFDFTTEEARKQYNFPLEADIYARTLSGKQDVVELYMKDDGEEGILGLEYIGTSAIEIYGTNTQVKISVPEGYKITKIDFVTPNGCGFKHYGENDDNNFEGPDVTISEDLKTETYTAPESETVTEVKYEVVSGTYFVDLAQIIVEYASTSENTETNVAIDATNFPDENFRIYVSEHFDSDEDGQLSAAEIAEVTSIEVLCQGIETLQGVEYFTALEALFCASNYLTALDITKNTALTILECQENQITKLDISKNTALTKLDCGGNQLTELVLSQNTALKNLYCYENNITALDITKNTALILIDCKQNQLTALDLSNNKELLYAYCTGNKLTSIDLSNNTAITTLYCSGNQLTALDLSYNTAITELDCFGNVRDLGEVDIKGFTVEGLDMSKVSNVSGATVKDGKFVPTDATVTEITYTYDTQCVKADMASQTFKLKVTPVGTATALTAPAAEKGVKAVKVIENGEIVIIKNGERFNLAGRKIE